MDRPKRRSNDTGKIMETNTLSPVCAYEIFERAREYLNNADVPETDRIIYDPDTDSFIELE